MRADMISADFRTRASAMCGPAGDQAPICFHADMSVPDTKHWETLLTIGIGIDTEQGELLYAEGNPAALAAKDYLRF